MRDDVQRMADEVAGLIASRFGGARRGTRPDLGTMLRRRGAALPRRLRREALRLAEADRLANQPRVARQLDSTAAARAHAALTQHLRPLGAVSRWQGRIGGVTAAVVFGLLLVAMLALWLMVRQGYVGP